MIVMIMLSTLNWGLCGTMPKSLERRIDTILMEYGLPLDNRFLVRVANHESLGGKHLRQIGGGPGRGYYQMEEATAIDILINMPEHPARYNLSCSTNLDYLLTYDLEFQTVLARLHLMRYSEEIPLTWDLEGQARYWKQYWNTSSGKGTVKQFMEHNQL